MNNVNDIIIELLSLLKNKLQLFRDIMEITLEQKKDIEENEANTIEELVNKKQSIIDSIDEIDRTFSEKFNFLKKQLKVNSMEDVDFIEYPMLKTLKLNVEEIMSLAQSIMQIEESNKEKLVGIINGIKKEMKQLSVGKKSIKAYEKSDIINDGIYIDKRK